jgi:ferredoxin
VLPYDDVRAILETAASFRLETCVCRLQQDELGTRRCDFPLESCLWFSFAESGEETGTISREAALAALDEAERVGLVHTVSNVARGIGYVCNCCGCCCGLLRGITEWGIEHSVAQANYFAEIDPATCTACGECEERCQVHAIDATVDGPRVVRRESCIGCGLLRHGLSRGVRPSAPQARRRDRAAARDSRCVGAHTAEGARRAGDCGIRGARRVRAVVHTLPLSRTLAEGA